MAKQYYKCPKCDSENFYTAPFQTDDDYAWRICHCSDCDFEWQEVYKFDFNESPKTLKQLDEKGNPLEETVEEDIERRR